MITSVRLWTDWWRYRAQRNVATFTHSLTSSKGLVNIIVVVSWHRRDRLRGITGTVSLASLRLSSCWSSSEATIAEEMTIAGENGSVLRASQTWFTTCLLSRANWQLCMERRFGSGTVENAIISTSTRYRLFVSVIHNSDGRSYRMLGPFCSQRCWRLKLYRRIDRSLVCSCQESDCINSYLVICRLCTPLTNIDILPCYNNISLFGVSK